MSPMHNQRRVRRPGTAVTVTADNFDRAQTDMYFAKFVKDGALGKFVHERELPLENAGPRPSRDTLVFNGGFRSSMPVR